MNYIDPIFTDIFHFIYPYVHSHLVSYVLFLVLNVGLAYLNGKWIKKLNRSSGAGIRFFKIMLIFFEVVILAYLCWFVFIYFHTFQTL